MNDDPLGPVRGIALALCTSIPMWLMIWWGVWWLVH